MGAESWKAHLGIALVQLNFAGYQVLTKLAVSEGLSRVVFCVYRDVLSLSILGPAAYFIEKRSRPPLTKRLLLSFFLLGLTGVYLNQLLFMTGLLLTSPTYAAALQPAIPVFTAVLATLIGAESLNWHRADGKAKVSGVVVCVAGAVLMTVYEGPPVLGDGYDIDFVGGVSGGEDSLESVGRLATALLGLGLDLRQVGCLCLIGNCLCFALYFALQAPLLAKYPHGLSLTAYSYAFGLLLMVVTVVVSGPDSSSTSFNGPEIYAVIYAGFVASALNFALMTYTNKILGPSTLAIYIPLQPVAASFLSWFIFGSSVFLGSVIGGILILIGLYLVAWSRTESHRLGIYARAPFSDASEASTVTLKDPLLKMEAAVSPTDNSNRGAV